MKRPQSEIDNRYGSPEGTSADRGRRALDSGVNPKRIDASQQAGDVLGGFLDDSDVAPSDGVSSPETTRRIADALGVLPGELARRRGDVDFAPGEALAVERLLAATGDRLLDAVRKAAATGPKIGALYVFRRMLAIHFAGEAMALGDEAGAGQALQRWRYPAGNGAQQRANMQTALERAGGTEVAAVLARRLLALVHSGANGATLNQAVRQAVRAASIDDVRAVWINGVLAAPAEFVAMDADRLDRSMRDSAEAGLAGRIARQRGAQGAATDETAAVLFALVGGLTDAFALAARDIRTPSVVPNVSRNDGGFDPGRGGGPLRAADFLSHALGLGSKLGDADGGVVKALGYRMTLRAEAYRRAAGQDAPLGAAVAGLIADPPMDLHLDVIDVGTYAALADPRSMANRNLREIRDLGGASNALLFLAPLLQEPEAVGRIGFDGSKLAPIAARWRGQVTAGGALRDLALARAASATAILAISAFSGMPVVDPTLRDPVDQVAALAAICNAALAGGEIDPDDVPQWSGALAGAVLAVAQFCAGRAFLQSFADRIATAGAAVAEPRALPKLPEDSLLRVVADRLDELTGRMTARRDLWGSPHGGEDAAIDAEMLRHGADATPIGKKTDFAGVPVNFRDWPAAYEEYRRLAGNDLKHPEHGLGAKDFLDAVVTGKSPISAAYRRMSDGSQGMKAVFIRHTIHDYRRRAQQRLLGDRRFRDFADYIQRMKKLKDSTPRSGEES